MLDIDVATELAEAIDRHTDALIELTNELNLARVERERKAAVKAMLGGF